MTGRAVPDGPTSDLCDHEFSATASAILLLVGIEAFGVVHAATWLADFGRVGRDDSAEPLSDPHQFDGMGPQAVELVVFDRVRWS